MNGCSSRCHGNGMTNMTKYDAEVKTRKLDIRFSPSGHGPLYHPGGHRLPVEFQLSSSNIDKPKCHDLLASARINRGFHDPRRATGSDVDLF